MRERGRLIAEFDAQFLAAVAGPASRRCAAGLTPVRAVGRGRVHRPGEHVGLLRAEVRLEDPHEEVLLGQVDLQERVESVERAPEAGLLGGVEPTGRRAPPGIPPSCRRGGRSPRAPVASRPSSGSVAQLPSASGYSDASTAPTWGSSWPARNACSASSRARRSSIAPSARRSAIAGSRSTCVRSAASCRLVVSGREDIAGPRTSPPDTPSGSPRIPAPPRGAIRGPRMPVASRYPGIPGSIRPDRAGPGDPLRRG